MPKGDSMRHSLASRLTENIISQVKVSKEDIDTRQRIFQRVMSKLQFGPVNASDVQAMVEEERIVHHIDTQIRPRPPPLPKEKQIPTIELTPAPPSSSKNTTEPHTPSTLNQIRSSPQKALRLASHYTKVNEPWAQHIRNDVVKFKLECEQQRETARLKSIQMRQAIESQLTTRRSIRTQEQQRDRDIDMQALAAAQQEERRFLEETMKQRLKAESIKIDRQQQYADQVQRKAQEIQAAQQNVKLERIELIQEKYANYVDERNKKNKVKEQASEDMEINKKIRESKQEKERLEKEDDRRMIQESMAAMERLEKKRGEEWQKIIDKQHRALLDSGGNEITEQNNRLSKERDEKILAQQTRQFAKVQQELEKKKARDSSNRVEMLATLQKQIEEKKALAEAVEKEKAHERTIVDKVVRENKVATYLHDLNQREKLKRVGHELYNQYLMDTQRNIQGREPIVSIVRTESKARNV